MSRLDDLTKSKAQMAEPDAPVGTSLSKRALLKAGWVAPVILAVNLPRSGFAANASGRSGDDDGGDRGGNSGRGNGNSGNGNNGNNGNNSNSGNGNSGNGNGNSGNSGRGNSGNGRD